MTGQWKDKIGYDPHSLEIQTYTVASYVPSKNAPPPLKNFLFSLWDGMEIFLEPQL